MQGLVINDPQVCHCTCYSMNLLLTGREKNTGGRTQDRITQTYDNFSVTVLSIHKRPVVGNRDISFPMKGWRSMMDWARSSEDRVTIPKNILSTGKPGKSSSTLDKHALCFHSTLIPATGKCCKTLMVLLHQ